MRLMILVLGSLALCAVGCSNKTTKTPTDTLPAPVVQQTTTEVTLPTVPKAAEKPAAPEKTDETVCQKGTTKRTLRIKSLQPKGCELWYSNFSDVKPVASSEIANTHCQTTHDNIKRKLEAADYKCSVGTAATTTTATPAAKPTATPAAKPTATPAVKATATPAVKASPSPSPTAAPAAKASPSPSPTASPAATVKPATTSAKPTTAAKPVSSPTPAPSASPAVKK